VGYVKKCKRCKKWNGCKKCGGYKNLGKNSLKRNVQSFISIVIVLTVITMAFLYKDRIEKYAMTGYFGVFIACIAATSTILLPAPGILVVIQYARYLNPAIVVLLGGTGTALGEMIGYILGRSGSEIAKIDTSRKIFIWFARHPNLLVFLFSIIPLPIFDFVGICAGMVKMHPIKFLLYCALGKTIKMALFVILTDFILNLI